MTIHHHMDLDQIEIPEGHCAVRAGVLMGPGYRTAALSMYADGHEHVAVMAPEYVRALRDKLTELLESPEGEVWACT